MSATKFTQGPWNYIASDVHHGPYVVGPHGGDICDCYTMSNPMSLSVRNGGNSKPILFQHEQSDANARLIAAAPDLYAALSYIMNDVEPTEYALSEGARKMADAALAKARGKP